MDHACPTDRSSGGCSDVLLTDVRSAEAFDTAAALRLAEDSTRAKEAMKVTLPSKMGSSPGRSDRELMLCTRAGGGGVAAATESRAQAVRLTTYCDWVMDVATSCYARSDAISELVIRFIQNNDRT